MRQFLQKSLHRSRMPDNITLLPYLCALPGIACSALMNFITTYYSLLKWLYYYLIERRSVPLCIYFYLNQMAIACFQPEHLLSRYTINHEILSLYKQNICNDTQIYKYDDDAYIMSLLSKLLLFEIKLNYAQVLIKG